MGNAAQTTLKPQWVEVRYMAVAPANLVGSGSLRMWLHEVPEWMADRNRQGETIMIVHIRED